MPNSSQPPRRPDQSRSNAESAPKPYGFVAFPSKAPNLKNPKDHHGHDRYRPDRLHGKLELKLTVKTAVHISTGIVARGEDVGDRVPLIKTMAQSQQQQLTIPGSSLKGVVRSVFETLTNSTLAVTTGRYRQKMPQERLPCNRKEELCPASLVFGALSWQGLIHFTDATCEAAKSSTGFMPSLYRPRPDQSPAYFRNGRAVGRKFYYHAVKAVSGGDRGIPVQQAGTEYVFGTTLQFMNLSAAEVGTLLIALGQDAKYPLALKVGGGKPIGMGTMTIEVVALEKPDNLKARYTTYALPESDRLMEQALKHWMEGAIAAAHRTLIEKPQLEALADILKWPTTRSAPEGMY
ncbi:CRISPR-associated protein [Synechococcales cyanobacterium C]|uniref:CRISPR-associated protein n=1 Tax=Petrachloros mirabilis ULC683 TaxID=2781853 RepID=A0A8K2A0Q9_9CYAN|nr:RAMP superfamily CRISPR-associated protein [Petrachloros mirabilis]NCJ07621.1 CRISPR-associated protein [Petrachloros mirabilis ULC683]